MARATLLLPAAARFGQQRLGATAARVLGRADHRETADAGRQAQLLRHFELTPGHWPIAALTRQAEAGDAAGSAWLRADPSYLRPDINGARLLAYGEALAMTDADRDALLPALRPLFGDAGFPLDAPTPSHWYLRLPRGTKLPGFSDPGEALGEDLFEHLADGAEGRRWRALLSETQVVLHNHPWNARRAGSGLAPINSLWFWGGGVLPDQVSTQHTTAFSDDESARALAQAACTAAALPARFGNAAGDVVFDLQAERDLARLQEQWLLPAVAAIDRGELERLELDLEDGSAFMIARSQRWRVWRGPRPRFGE
ncbi:hypothetical protein IP90_01614 [Luteimonas cucumeris]|uniref:Phosphoglycerate mutase n=1 Tax=Luteimonas cucumeris TaxID=985012 RepID=A0A562L857_9GAMM|nr:phosphoglycerate mutase [Luteimonas cucumeris]TWI03798.1 hypothetical protein IP90_01614 [Luteimonas cucumeris]